MPARKVLKGNPSGVKFKHGKHSGKARIHGADTLSIRIPQTIKTITITITMTVTLTVTVTLTLTLTVTLTMTLTVTLTLTMTLTMTVTLTVTVTNNLATRFGYSLLLLSR